MDEGPVKHARDWLRLGESLMEHRDRGHLHQAMVEFERAAAAFRIAGDEDGEVSALSGLEEVERRLVEEAASEPVEEWREPQDRPFWEEWNLAARALGIQKEDPALDPIRFDFTPASLGRIDQRYSRDWFRDSGQGERRALELQLGFYLGETLVRHAGGRWIESDKLATCAVQLGERFVWVFQEAQEMIHGKELRVASRYHELLPHREP
jgi:hypothetical protein